MKKYTNLIKYREIEIGEVYELPDTFEYFYGIGFSHIGYKSSTVTKKYFKVKDTIVKNGKISKYVGSISNSPNIAISYNDLTLREPIDSLLVAVFILPVVIAIDLFKFFRFNNIDNNKNAW